MKILVTGGGGFIGSHVAGELIAKGHEVIIYDIIAQPFIRHKEASYIHATILDRHTLCKHLKGCDAVMHFAALLGVKRVSQEQLRCLSINIEGTMALLNACVMERVPYVLFASSSEVYGDMCDENKKQKINEESAWNPKSNYAITKLVGENYISAFHKEYGINYNIVRFFNVYGPGQVDEFVISKFVKMVLDGKPPTVHGDGRQIRSFCYIDDAAKAVVRALETKSAWNQIFNIGNDAEPVSMKELAQRVIRKAGGNMDPVHIDFSKSDRSSTREIYYRVPDIEKAKKALGYRPSISLDEGIDLIIKQGAIRSR